MLFTDNDTIPHPDLVAEHLDWHASHPEEEIAVLGHVRWAPEIEVTTFMQWLDRGIQFDYPNIRGTEAGWGRFYGANVSVKRAFAERVGDFDEERLPYGYEDLDWSYRASRLGLRVLYNRRAVVDHLREMTLEFWKRRAARVAVSERAFTRLHPELEPWFHRLFTDAAAQPPASGRGLRLAPFGCSRGCRWSAPGSGTASTCPTARRSRPTSWRRGRPGRPTAPTSQSARPSGLSSAAAAARAGRGRPRARGPSDGGARRRRAGPPAPGPASAPTTPPR